MKKMRSEQKKGLKMRFFASFSLGLLAWSCGSKIDSGNTGSETHWLKSCDEDADCGEYSCYCGICSRACDEQADCKEVASVSSQCSDAPASKTCGGDTPARLCVKFDNQADADAGDTSSGDTTSGPLSTICDGSDDVRWIYQSSGGFVPDEYAFTGRYGNGFLVIDGKCNFWGQTEPGALSTGTVLASSIDQFQKSEFGRMNRYDDLVVDWGCPDAGPVLVWDPSGAFYGSTCGIPSGFEELETTLGSAYITMATVLRQGTPSQGPLRLLLLEAIDEEGTTDWPLELDPTALIPQVRPSSEELGAPLAGIGFAPGPRADALRGVMNGGGVTLFKYPGNPELAFSALYRDELPPKIGAVLDAVSKEAAFKRDPRLGAACGEGATCEGGLSCQERVPSAGGGLACNTCVEPQDPDWLCRSNDDCCGSTICCVDCGEKSGTCIAEPNPCPTCIQNGGSWVVPDTCEAECPADSSCFTQTCPDATAEGSCAAAGRFEECWAAGCGWVSENEAQYCTESIISVPDSEPCEVTASDETLPGVSVHLEADDCTFVIGKGGQFRYRIELEQSLDFTTEASQGCGLCGEVTEPQTWTKFVIAGDGLSYCPECDVGCCPSTQPMATSLDMQVIEGTVDWPGLEWNGPSDTLNVPEGEFPAGSYDATLRFGLPGVGEVVATLPIIVRGLLTP